MSSVSTTCKESLAKIASQLSFQTSPDVNLGLALLEYLLAKLSSQAF